MSPRKYRTHRPPPPPSLSSLPDEIVVRCLARVPRIYHLSLSWVSKNLRSLVRSLPEIKGLRSVPNKTSIYVCSKERYNDVHWFTLHPTEETVTQEFRLIPNTTPFPSYGSSTVVVGSNIYFIGGSNQPSSDLWILDTQSGTITQGPSMTVPREKSEAAVGVIDGKIYVIGGGESDGRFHEEIQVEVFDTKSETWELAGMENVRKTSRRGASVEGKIYMVEYEEINVYNPRAGERERLVLMVSQRLERGRKDMLNDWVRRVCVVEDVLFALFMTSGIMWFNTKLNVWRRLLGPDGKELPFISHAEEITGYDDGRLVVLYMLAEKGFDDGVTKKSFGCMLVSLHRAGDMICGTVDWSGTVGTVPYWFRVVHCLAVSD